MKNSLSLDVSRLLGFKLLAGDESSKDAPGLELLLRDPRIGAKIGKGPAPVSDARLKINIRPVAMLPNGLRLYSFQYRRNPTTTYVGVMAQDLLQSENSEFRDAVVVGSDGYYAVKYDKLGLKMLTLNEWRAVSTEFGAAILAA
jgi:Chaperone of endosialidase